MTYLWGAGFSLPMMRSALASLSKSPGKVNFSDEAGLPACSLEALRGLLWPCGRTSASTSSEATLFPLREGFSSASSSWVEEVWVSSDQVNEVSRVRWLALPFWVFDPLGITTCSSSTKRVISKGVLSPFGTDVGHNICSTRDIHLCKHKAN